MAAILAHLKLDCEGNLCAIFVGRFVELNAFPHLTQEEADIDEKNLQVDDKKATLMVKAEINGEMYVENLYFV